MFSDWYEFWVSLDDTKRIAVKIELNKYAKSIGYEDWNHYASRNPDYPQGKWFKIYKEAYKKI